MSRRIDEVGVYHRSPEYPEGQVDGKCPKAHCAKGMVDVYRSLEKVALDDADCGDGKQILAVTHGDEMQAAVELRTEYTRPYERNRHNDLMPTLATIVVPRQLARFICRPGEVWGTLGPAV